MTYSGDHDHLLAHEPQRLAPPLTSFEYQGDFSSQLTEVAGKILFYGNLANLIKVAFSRKDFNFWPGMMSSSNLSRKFSPKLRDLYFPQILFKILI